MSWSFHAVGKPFPVLEKARKELNMYPLMEPEETIKKLVLSIFEEALLIYPEDTAVKATASGSQSPIYDKNGALIPGKFSNSLHIDLDHLYGFVE
jgi:hypothetical protein